MKNQGTLAFRLEYKGNGPFWEPKITRLLERKCRQVTPEWKNLDESCSSFLEYYCFHADSPHAHPAMAWHLDHGTPHIRFGFATISSLLEQCGADRISLYEKQLRGLLEHVPEFSVRAYLVDALAQSDTEILFQTHRATCMAQANSWDELLKL